jgi:hypothetical protein
VKCELGHQVLLVAPVFLPKQKQWIAMTRLFSFAVLGFFLLFSACANQQARDSATDAEQKAYEEMMVIHDEVMPRMGEINRLSRQLRSAYETIDTTDRELLGQIDNAVRALEEADRGMMAWMNMNAGNLLEKLRAEKSHAEIMTYLNKEKAAISEVADNMRSSISQGSELVDKLETAED